MYSKECLLSYLSWYTYLLNNEILRKLNRPCLDSIPSDCVILILDAVVLVNRLLVTAHNLKPFKLGKELQ